MEKIIIGSDKSGFTLKEALKTHLVSKGYQVEDVGLQDPEGFKAYFEVAPVLAKKVQSGEYERGLLCCGTGMGMAMLANKYKGVYAAVVEGAYAAKMCRMVNQANVLCLGGFILGPQKAAEMLDIWLATSFTQGCAPERASFLSKAFDQVQKLEEEIY